jgi:hypothetical protein
MTRVLIIVAILLLLVYFLRSIFQVSVRARSIRRMPEERGRVIEGEPPQVRDARESLDERDPRT